MFIDPDELDQRINRESNLIHRLPRKGSNYKGRDKETTEGPGRKEGDVNIPPIIQEIIATVAHYDKNINVADSFNVGPQQVSNLKRGLVSPSRGPEDETNLALQAKIDRNLGIIRDKALEKLVDTLTAITPEKIGLVTKVKDLGSLAASLSAVVERSIPAHLRNKNADDSGQTRAIQLNIYAPQQKTERDYEAIVVK